MNPSTEHRRFDPRPDSVTAARRFVRECGAASGLDQDVVHWAELMTSELATNVVQHARTPFVVELAIGDREVTVSVADGTATQPRPREVDVPEPGGRGLTIIRGASDRWGVEPDGTGKRVWCTFVHTEA